MIRKATFSDLDALMPIFDEARETIAALGIDQWQDGYPAREVIAVDILQACSYAVMCDDEIVGTFVIVDDGEPTYDHIYDGHWLTGDDERAYIALHRVAVAVKKRGSGISTAIIDYAVQYAKTHGCASVRIDTHAGNIVMRKMLEKHGFVYCGVIYLQSGAARVAYEKVLS